MVGIQDVSEYVDEVRSQFASGHAGEHAYRPALQRLMRSFDDVEAINDPKRSEHGAPDFVFQRQSNRDVILGYAEAKDIDADLAKVERSDQMNRYSGYQNLYLTNYLEFRLYRDGILSKSISIGSVEKDKINVDTRKYQRLVDELSAFLELPPQRITNGKRLAEILGAKARRIRDDILEFFDEKPGDSEELVKIYNLMRQMLVHDLDKSKFADMYAQTLVYGLFVARYRDESPDTFSREESRSLIPKTNPFLRHFFDHIVGPSFDERLARAVDELCVVFRVSDVRGIVHAHLNKSSREIDKDPIIHFYEDFLHAYDPVLRKKMGAYYTPLPVVDFIVRQVDAILKSHFSIRKGIADTGRIKVEHDSGQVTKLRSPVDGRRTIKYSKQEVEYHRVQILDPAVGTATFLNQIVKFISLGFKGQAGRWPSYVNEDLLPRLNGFELMMAPYTIAHLKLGMTFEESGVSALSRRIGVYLTNTLDEGLPEQPDLFSFGLAEAVTQEGEQAGRVKTEFPVMVIVGNPPYSVISSNLSDYQRRLVEKYKFVDGVRIIEKGALRLEMNLNDDYVKFIAFSEETIKRNGQGVLAFINNNTWLDSNSHRGMRHSLLSTFDEIFVVNVSNNKPGDENVFDIKQKVCINIFVKAPGERKSSLATVHRVDLDGRRSEKFEWLMNTQIKDIEWESFTPRAPQYELVSRDWSVGAEYVDFIPIDKIFMKSSTTVLTARDKFAVDFSRDELEKRIGEFADKGISDDELASRYGLKGNVNWKLNDRRSTFRKKRRMPESVLERYTYRPFDDRFIAYDDSIVQCTRNEVMQHVVGHRNYVLTTCRFTTSNTWQHVLIGKHLIDDSFISNKSKERGHAFALYLFHEDGSRRSNLASSVLRDLCVNVEREVEPTEVMDYIYAILHSSTYRKKYLEFLRTGFPRIPRPYSEAEFTDLASLGQDLRLLHLMETSEVDEYITTFPFAGSDVVEKIAYKNGDVHINSSQVFGGVPPEVWHFEIGAYRPAQKWLKDRNGRKLSSNEIDQYQRIIKVLAETERIMSEIDEIKTVWSEAK